jgi:hypothetical protein
MGISDRDYMKARRRSRTAKPRLPLKARLLFWLWQLRKRFGGG